VVTSLRGRRVLVTGHTGFKGSWLVTWLRRLGCEVTGYALEAPERSMYRLLALDDHCTSVIADVRDRDALAEAVESARPDIVFHLAAQPVVLASYADPLGTLQTNVLGTANLLDVLRTIARPCAVVVVTTDKCYENEGHAIHAETDPLGGHDLYSASKAAAEIVTAAYRRSFFGSGSNIRVATARAGNVIGGGDWTADRIVPDCIAALERGEPIRVRNPRFIRPWQHVLDPLRGYLALAAAMLEGRDDVCDAWNFGPRPEDTRTVEELVQALLAEWGEGTWIAERRDQPHESPVLRLAIDKAEQRLGWTPRWPFAEAVKKTVEWYRACHDGASRDELRLLTDAQIAAHEADA
jgi:CDP-glucose 4,6-dehydratase